MKITYMRGLSSFMALQKKARTLSIISLQKALREMRTQMDSTEPSMLYSSRHKTVPCQGKRDQVLWHNFNKWGIDSLWFPDLGHAFPLIRWNSFRVTLTSILRKPQMVFTAFRKALCLILAQPLCQYQRKLWWKADCCFCSNNICQYLLKEEEWQMVTNESLANNAITFFSSPWSNPLKIPRRETTSIPWTQI